MLQGLLSVAMAPGFERSSCAPPPYTAPGWGSPSPPLFSWIFIVTKGPAMPKAGYLPPFSGVWRRFESSGSWRWSRRAWGSGCPRNIEAYASGRTSESGAERVFKAAERLGAHKVGTQPIALAPGCTSQVLADRHPLLLGGAWAPEVLHLHGGPSPAHRAVCAGPILQHQHATPQVAHQLQVRASAQKPRGCEASPSVA